MFCSSSAGRGWLLPEAGGLNRDVVPVEASEPQDLVTELVLLPRHAWGSMEISVDVHEEFHEYPHVLLTRGAVMGPEHSGYLPETWEFVVHRLDELFF